MTEIHHLLIVEDAAECMDFISRCIQDTFPAASLHQATSVRAAMAILAAQPHIDLAIVDLGLPDGSGLGVISALQASQPAATVVVHTLFDDDASLFDALRRGATGYLLKSDPPVRTQQALRALVAGEPPLSPRIALRMLREFREAGQLPQHAQPSHAGDRRAAEQVVADESPPHSQLTPRELETLTLAAKGLRLPELAEHLQVTRSTAATYLKRIYRKLSINSRAEATLEAARLGLVRISPDHRRG